MPDQNKKMNVLIVDDESDIRQVINSFLETMACWQFIIESGDGHDAFLKSQRQNFDLVIADLKMPKWDGIDFLSNYKSAQDQAGKATTVLLISGNFTKEDIEKAAKLGVKHFLAKPFNGQQFLDKVEEIIPPQKKAS